MDDMLDFQPEEPEDTWQPIETAPEGDSVLILDGEARMLAAWKCGEEWRLVTQDGACIDIWHPTHWMPLPDPPAEDSTIRTGVSYSVWRDLFRKDLPGL